MFNTKMLTQKILIGIVILLMLFLMGCSSNQNKNASTANQQNNTSTNLTQEDKNNSNTSPSPKPTTTTTHTLHCTPHTLKDNFNYEAKNNAKISVRMNYYDISSGSGRYVYSYKLATGLDLLLGVNKNNTEVEVITLVKEYDGQSLFNFAMSMAILINLFTSEVPASQIVQDMGFNIDNFDFNGIGGTKIVGDVKFICTGNKDGIVFMISDKNG